MLKNALFFGKSWKNRRSVEGGAVKDTFLSAFAALTCSMKKE